MFDKILIANRGEIAVRVASTARRLGIRSVAVYSSADRHALHVDSCDEAFCIGGASAAESYLNGARILEVARECGADAIHPGYGFLSENAAFARDCEAAGIVFIGPPAAAIEAMGSKSEAKALMAEAGVPLVPGYHGDDQDDDLLKNESQRIGYPQLIKASAGGGGKGMRLVENADEFAAALVSARREASASFGDDKVLIERYLTRPRHVEMQVFADRCGSCVHLFERDCSIQRRHQKIIEEAPAPGMTAGLRAQMGKAAVDCARAIEYVGAGTVEFLLDADGSFYFMEMNTRLQVEHPVTEMITGQDLVEWQFRVAAGAPLPLEQAQIGCHGHAVEARIYAETPRRDFMPAAGRIRYLDLPDPADGVRIDTGVRRGDLVGINYDPMIAKLIVHADSRDLALIKLARALAQFRILGLNTNIGFLGSLLALPEFRAADFDTGFIARHQQALFTQDSGRLRLAKILAAAALLPAFDTVPADAVCSAWDGRDMWRMNLPAKQRIELEYEGEAVSVVATRTLDGWSFAVDGESLLLRGGRLDRDLLRVELGERLLEVPVLREAAMLDLIYQGQAFQFTIPDRTHADESDAADLDHPQAPMSGAVVALPVSVGDTVEPGDRLIVIEAMKMEHSIVARVGGRVEEILFAVGDQVDEGDTLVILEVD